MTTEIDTDVLYDLMDAMGDDFAEELLMTFLDEAPGMFDALTQAVSDGDTDAFRRAAHSIKSNAQTFGATELAEQAREMELSGPTEDPAGDIAGLRTAFNTAALALKAALDD